MIAVADTPQRIRVGLLGSQGRMGQQVAKLIQTEFRGQAELAAQAAEGDALEPLLRTDVVIDFSLPDAMAALAETALATLSRDPQTKLPTFVVGSTGWKAEQTKTLERLATKTSVVQSSNFSTGVQALLAVLRQASPLLTKLGYAPVIVETHHRHKKDAPSGTAVSMQKVIAPQAPTSVQTHAIRAGEIFGDHEATFYGPGDHLTFGHFAQDRSIFARGAIEVALWLARRPASSGILDMELFFSEVMR